MPEVPVVSPTPPLPPPPTPPLLVWICGNVPSHLPLSEPLDQGVQVTSEIRGWVRMMQELALVDQSDPLWAQFFTTCNCRCPCLQVGQTLEFLRSLQEKNTSILAVASVLPSSPVTMSCPQFPSLASLPVVCMWLAGVPQGFEIRKLVAWCDPVGR